MAAQAQVLRGLKVVDFGHYAAGPMAGMLLADYGADVVKIDPPGGPVFDHPANAMWNRGKRSIALDLKSEEGRRVARDLIRQADVVIENFRPGVMAGWGLADADVRDANPRLIYVSLPGFAPDDPRSAYPAWDGVIYAAVDAFRPQIRYHLVGIEASKPPADRDGRPLANSELIPSAYAAILSSNCVVAALMVRERSGLGQRIEVPLFDAMLQGCGVSASTLLPFVPVTTPTFTPLEIHYECADGRWFHPICSIERHGEALLRYLGNEAFIERGLTKVGITSEPQQYAELYDYMTEIFRTKTAKEWEQVFVDLGLPGSPCRTLDEFLQHEMLLGSNYLIPVGDAGGEGRQPNTPVILSTDEIAPAKPAPRLDGHRAEILAELDAGRAETPSEIRPSELARTPLAGVKVIDLCIILAGPVSGRTLAEFGAEVIKVDDPVRGANAFHDDVNRGKQSVFLDLRDATARDRFWTLVEEADVVLQNFRLSVLDKYGITAEAIKARNPKAIWVSTNAYGDVGPWAHLPGYEGSIQASTGLQVRYGGEGPPSSWPYAVHDYATGYLTGFGVLLALYERERTGRVHEVHAALARTASILQSKSWMEALSGAKPGSIDTGFFEGLFQCARGWVYAGTNDVSAARRAFALSDTDDLGAVLERYCRDRDVNETVADLRSKGFGAHELAWIRQVMQDRVTQTRGTSELRQNFRGAVKAYPVPGPWMSLSRITLGPPAEFPGSGVGRFRS